MSVKYMSVDDVWVDPRRRRALGDVDTLMASIELLGLKRPIVVTSSHRLILGWRRLDACRALGHDKIHAYCVDEVADMIDLFVEQQTHDDTTKPMTLSELVSVGLTIEEVDAERRRSRVRERGRFVARGRTTHIVRPLVAKMLGLSETSYARAKSLIRAAERGDERAAEAVRQMDASRSITPQYNRWRGRPSAPSGRQPVPKLAEPDDPFWVPTRNSSNARAVAQRRFLIEHYAASGMSSDQMESKVNLTAATIRRIAKETGIVIPADEAIGKSKHRLDATRMARETVLALENVTVGLDLINYDEIDESDAREWVALLEEPIRDINNFVKRLRRRVNDEGRSEPRG